MFNKREEEQPREQVLLGEDFDIFPDLDDADMTDDMDDADDDQWPDADTDEDPDTDEDTDAETDAYGDALPAAAEPDPDLPDPDLPDPNHPEEEAPPTRFETFIKSISEENWKKIQIIGGIVLGLAACACIVFLDAMETFSGVGVVIAALLVLLIPRWVEGASGRSLKLHRRVLAIVIGVGLVALLVYGFIINPSYFAPPAIATTPTPAPTATPGA